MVGDALADEEATRRLKSSLSRSRSRRNSFSHQEEMRAELSERRSPPKT